RQAKAFWSEQRWKGSLEFAVATRGTDVSRWTRKNPPNTVERSLALLGRTADTLRVRDLAGLLAMLKEGGERPDEKVRVRLVGRGPQGVLAAYAALLVPGAVDEVVII